MVAGSNRPDVHAIPVLRAGLDFPDSRRSDHAFLGCWHQRRYADRYELEPWHYHSQSDTMNVSTFSLCVALLISRPMLSASTQRLAFKKVR